MLSIFGVHKCFVLMGEANEISWGFSVCLFKNLIFRMRNLMFRMRSTIFRMRNIIFRIRSIIFRMRIMIFRRLLITYDGLNDYYKRKQGSLYVDFRYHIDYSEKITI